MLPYRSAGLMERMRIGSIVFRDRTGDLPMHIFRPLAAVVLGLVPATVLADSTEWRRFAIPSTGTNVEIPVAVFSKDTELPDGGTGRRFYTDDRRAKFTVQSVANTE